MDPMHGKTVVITGATSGIGEVAATRLAAAGARIVLTARDPERAASTLDRIRRAGPAVEHMAVHGDLSQLSQARRVALEIGDAAPAIDVLINNAGAIFPRRRETPDGLEMTFALNHMAAFIITHSLLDNLRRAPSARIVTTSSDAHRTGRLDFDDLQTSTRAYTTFRAYSASKLCNVLFTRELAHRLQGTSITANAVHPGFVKSRFYAAEFGALELLRPLVSLFAVSPEKGAETLVHVAASRAAEGASRQYFVKCRSVRPSRAAEDSRAGARLWEVSEQIAGIWRNSTPLPVQKNFP
jgi:NAD(P)-dependent dehydrogenase (short-subunit alcohol dehydrogenase family)